MLPEHAPAEYADRAVLWNAVEKSERYCTAQLSREIEIALPAKLTHEQNISLVRGYVKDNFVNAGMCADVCFHNKDDGNPHVHIMLTMRPIETSGKWGQKSRTVNGREKSILLTGMTATKPKNGERRLRNIATPLWSLTDSSLRLTIAVMNGGGLILFRRCISGPPLLKWRSAASAPSAAI